MGSTLRPLRRNSQRVRTLNPLISSIPHTAVYRLKRVYILFNAKHGLNEVDRVMLESLNEKCQTTGGQGFTLQAVITKVDSLAGEFAPAIRKMQQEIFETAPLCLPAIVTAASKVQVGTDEVRRSIIEACGLGRIGATLIRT